MTFSCHFYQTHRFWDFPASVFSSDLPDHGFACHLLSPGIVAGVACRNVARYSWGDRNEDFPQIEKEENQKTFSKNERHYSSYKWINVIYKSQISSNNHSKRTEFNNSAWLAANFTPGDGWDGLFAGSGCTGTAPLIAWSLADGSASQIRISMNFLV